MTIQSQSSIDLRSDTVTQPTESMRAAMASAEVGDDVYGEDPTVNRLEALAAQILGKEAALFVPSGTMGNLVSVLSQCGRGDEMILGDNAHIFYYEQGGAAAVGGIQPRTVPNLPDGSMDLDALQGAIRGEDDHFPVTRLIAVENTHNRCGGTVLPLDYMDSVADLAHERGLRMHVDGARIWNAAVALNISPARLLRGADSVSACLSKGLAAPVGSVVAGDRAFVKRARRMRKQVGGGMRQAGVLAAAGIVALNEMIGRLAEDHANAQRLAHGLQALESIRVNMAAVQTNLVYFEIARPDVAALDLATALAELGVQIIPIGPRTLRAVTHYQITTGQIDVALDSIQSVLQQPTIAAGQGIVYG